MISEIQLSHIVIYRYNAIVYLEEILEHNVKKRIYGYYITTEQIKMMINDNDIFDSQLISWNFYSKLILLKYVILSAFLHLYQFEINKIHIQIVDIMFAKIKEKVLRKAFSYAFTRYDKDKSGKLNRDQLTSLLNDTFQLVGYPHKVSWVQAKLAMKMFDDDGDKEISQNQAYKVAKTLLTNAGSLMGGFGGGQGKVGGALPPDDDCQQFQVKSGVAFEPDQEIDEQKLEQRFQQLPPRGQNVAEEDKMKTQQEGEGQGGFLL